MIENTPRCRPCGNSLKSEEGCVFCLECKAQLIWPIISDAENDLSASSIITGSLRVLKTRLKRLQEAMKLEGANYDPRLTRDLTSIGRTLKELAAEQRKLEDREEARYDSLGIEGRMNLFVAEFFCRLPEDYQVKLLSDMRDVYSAQNAPLLPESTDE